MQLEINGRRYEVQAQADENLLQVLRDELDLTGSKYGCGEGACGACTVLLDGAAIRSCVTPVGSTIGKKITTIEGLAQNGKLHKVQQAFLKADVFQCAYCASGMIMSATALLDKNSRPTQPQILRAMQGNICRCGTHPRIVEAIEIASKS
jgi:aerobic-type carbon monoxide dehydrogenase small subunit (CoxS/CutS family)